MGPTIFQNSNFLKINKNEITIIFQILVKKTFKLICNNNIYENNKGSLKKRDDDNDA